MTAIFGSHKSNTKSYNLGIPRLQKMAGRISSKAEQFMESPLVQWVSLNIAVLHDLAGQTCLIICYKA